MHLFVFTATAADVECRSCSVGSWFSSLWSQCLRHSTRSLRSSLA